MAGADSPSVKQEQQNTSAENSNDNPRERNPPGGGNRGPRGRKGGTRFSGGRGGGMGQGNRNNDGPVRTFLQIFLNCEKFLASFVPVRHICFAVMRNNMIRFKACYFKLIIHLI